MGVKFNPFTGQFDLAGGGGGAPTWAPTVATEAALGTAGNTPGDVRVTLDTDYIWVWDDATSRWINTGIKSANFGSTPGAQGYTLDYVNVSTNRRELRLTLQPADASNPGGVTTTAQTFGGDKTFADEILANGGLDVTATGGTDTLNIGANNADVINIGRSGATVNIIGTTLYENVTQLQVQDPLITLNKGGGAGSAAASGIELEEDGSITGFAKTSGDRLSWELKAPATAGSFLLTPAAENVTLASSSTASRILTLPDASDTLVGKATTDTLTNKTLAVASNNITSTASRVAIFDGSGNLVADSAVDTTELSYLDGVTSAIQTQLNGKASTTLNNLGTTAINATLLPASDLGVALGSSSLRFSEGNIRTTKSSFLTAVDGALATQLQIDATGVASPSGTSTAASIKTTGLSNNSFGIYSSNNGTADANATSAIRIETGNKTAGTGDSGAIVLLTGTSAGGTRGNITLDGNSVIISSVLLPNTTNTQNVGSTTKIFDEAFVNFINDSTDVNVLDVQNRELVNAAGTAVLIFSGTDLDANTRKIVNVQDPSSAQDVATKAYVDANTFGSPGDIQETSFTAADNQSSPANVTGLAFANGVVRSFEALVSIVRDATYAMYQLNGIQKGASWELSQESVGDATGIVFTITNAGQIQYTSTSTGNTATLKFRAETTSV